MTEENLESPTTLFKILTSGIVKYSSDIDLFLLNTSLLKYDFKAVKTHDNEFIILKSLKLRQKLSKEIFEMVTEFLKNFNNENNLNINSNSINKNKNLKKNLEKNLENVNLCKLRNLKVINDKNEFTELFMVENDEYLLENFDEYFGTCEYCKIIKVGKSAHDYCNDKFNELLLYNNT